MCGGPVCAGLKKKGCAARSRGINDRGRKREERAGVGWGPRDK